MSVVLGLRLPGFWVSGVRGSGLMAQDFGAALGVDDF